MTEQQINKPVIIDSAEYASLITSFDRYQILINELLRTARVGYDRTCMFFEDSVVDLLIRAMEREAYEKRLKELIDEKYGVKREEDE